MRFPSILSLQMALQVYNVKISYIHLLFSTPPGTMIFSEYLNVPKSRLVSFNFTANYGLTFLFVPKIGLLWHPHDKSSHHTPIYFLVQCFCFTASKCIRLGPICLCEVANSFNSFFQTAYQQLYHLSSPNTIFVWSHTLAHLYQTLLHLA